jgi:ABC-type branched-subunit amino acid transport system substrate-binding protein
MRLRPRNRAEVLRLSLAAAVVAGVVVLVVILTGSGSGSHKSAPLASGSQAPINVVPSQTGDEAAVTRSLRHGRMIVVIDQPSSGLFAEQNRSIAQGAGIAINELNAAGGLVKHIQVKLVPQNLDGLSAAEVERRLRSEAAAALVLPCDTDSQLSLTAEAAQYKTLMLAPCNLDPTAGERYPTYWPVGMSTSDEAYGLTTFMRRLGYQNAFIVTAPGSRYVQFATNYFRAAAQRTHIRIVGSATVSLTTKDFSGLAHTIHITSPRPSIIFTALPPPVANQMAAGLRAQGLPQSLLGASVLSTPLTFTDASALSEAVFASYGFPPESPAARHFIATYKKLFGNEPVGSFPGLGFETIRVLEAAVHQARSAMPKAIEQALSKGLALEGVALAERRYRPGKDHNPIGPVAVEKDFTGHHFEPVLAANPE